MKKALVTAAALGYLLFPVLALAQGNQGVTVEVQPPTQGVNPSVGVGTVVSNALTIVFVLAGIAVLAMLVWGAFSWITSGGAKESVDAARKRIVAALIGLAVLALAYLITVVVGQIVGINVLDLKKIPSLGSCGVGQVYDPTGSLTADKKPGCVKAPDKVPAP